MGKKKKTQKIKQSAHENKKVENKQPDQSKSMIGFSVKEIIRNELFYLKLMIFIFPFLYGLFYEFTATFAGGILCVYLLVLVIRRKKFYFSGNVNVYLLMFVFLSYLLVSLWAADQGMAFIGFLKFSPCMIFLIILMQFKKEEIRACFDVIPWAGAVMVITTAPTIFIPGLADYFYDAGRLGGFFQYANTFALFLLIGIIVIANKNEATPSNLIRLGILICGVLLTGSRTSFLLMAVLLIYFFVKAGNLRKSLSILVGSLVFLGCVFVLTTGNFQNIGRIMTISLGSSTFIGRFLYDVDGINLLLQKPFGVGYMGFYYLQGQIQTGVYSVRFIHNELLQMGLDAGILAAVAFVFVCGKSLLSKKVDALEKLILGIILIHACFDFDLQFIIIFFILLMTLDIGKAKAVESKGIRNAVIISTGIFCLGYLLVSMGLYATHNGNNSFGLKILSFNTEAKVALLIESSTTEDIDYWADAILAGNKYVTLAYEGKVFVAVQKNDFENMVNYEQKAIKCAKYDIKKYEVYLQMLEKTMNHYNDLGDRNNLLKYANDAFDIPDALKKLEETTSPLAFQIDDKPVFTLSQNSQIYIEKLRKTLNK